MGGCNGEMGRECAAPWCRFCSLIVTVLICTTVLHVPEFPGDMGTSGPGEHLQHT